MRWPSIIRQPQIGKLVGAASTRRKFIEVFFDDELARYFIGLTEDNKVDEAVYRHCDQQALENTDLIDVIEQVMSNAAIEKIDPLGRKCNTNNSLLAIWIANMGSSFFGGMTNLDGLAKSTTNKLAGAMTKFSVLVVGVVVAFFVMNSQYLEYLPKFSLAAIMIFSGWKMIMGLWHVAHYGQYAMILATVCGLLVYKVGIFEGLLIAMAVHGLINYVVFSHADKVPGKVIIKKYLDKFSSGGGGAD